MSVRYSGTPVSREPHGDDPDHKGRGNAPPAEEAWPDAGEDLDLPDSAPSLGPATLVGDRYRTIRRIGAGSMGEVWEAEQIYSHKLVAIKVLSASRVGKKDHKRFIREAQATASLQHHNIVRVEDFGTLSSGQPYFVMEKLEGMTLAQWLARGERTDWIATREFMLHLCNALDFAHGRGVIHRDLKPSNVFVVQRRSLPPYCKVIDFGVAKMISEAHGGASFTATGAILGTPAYISPEQCSGKTIDVRTDVYSLGCIAYEMATGSRPFDGTTLAAVVYQHIFESPTPPRRRAPTRDIPADLEAVILKCLAKRPEHRFESVDALRTAVIRVGTGAPPVKVEQNDVPDPSPGSTQVRVSGAVTVTYSDADPQPRAAGSKAGARELQDSGWASARQGLAGPVDPLDATGLDASATERGASDPAPRTRTEPATGDSQLASRSSSYEAIRPTGSGLRSSSVSSTEPRGMAHDGSRQLLEPMPWGPGASPYKIKGTAYRGFLRWVEVSHPGGLSDCLERLPTADLRSFVGQYFMPSVFYDILPLATCAAVCSAARGQSFLHFAKERAVAQALFDLHGVYKPLLSLTSLEDIANRMPRHQKQYFSFGEVVPRVRASGGVELKIEGLCEPIAPWFLVSSRSYWATVINNTVANGKSLDVEMALQNTDEWVHDFLVVRATLSVRLN